MIIIDEPSSAKRLIAETLKMSKSSLQSLLKDKIKIVGGGSFLTLIVFVFVNFFFMNGVFSENELVFAKSAEGEVKKQINFNEIINNDPEDIIQDIITETEEKVEEEKEEEEQDVFAEELAVMLEGHPMAEMADLIAQQDKTVAALIVGIGKKESNWGKRSPSKDGQDCFNYWGYKTSGTRGQALGHACFGSREEAVETIAKRINTLVYEYNRNTPAKMVVWKCGSSCAATGGQAAANKWISDVQIYYNRVLAIETVKNENDVVAKAE